MGGDTKHAWQIERITNGPQIPVQPWVHQRSLAHLRAQTCIRETEGSAFYPQGVMEAQLSVITMHGEMIREDFFEKLTICEYCGEQVIPNGGLRTVRYHDPTRPTTRLYARITHDFNINPCCPPRMQRRQHSHGGCCCPTGLRAYVEKGRGYPD